MGNIQRKKEIGYESGNILNVTKIVLLPPTPDQDGNKINNIAIDSVCGTANGHKFPSDKTSYGSYTECKV